MNSPGGGVFAGPTRRKRKLLTTAFCLVALAAPAAAHADPPTPGLVAAYSFDEGSGSVVADASGNGHVGTVSGATWAGGRYGHALSFNGTNASVLLGSLGTFYQGGFTLEAWVQKASATRSDAAVVGSWAGNGPMLWVDHIATHYFLTLGGSYSGYLDSGAAPVAGQWQHLAATYDGTTARYYIDGSLVASRAAGGVGNSDVWRIGAYGSSPGGFFDGLIDDVRIYDQARSGSEIQTDMDRPVSFANGGVPTMPGSFSVTAATESTLSVGWSASTDNHGVSGYILYVNGSQAATTTGTSFTFTGLQCSKTYQVGVEAFDASGNVSPRALKTTTTGGCSDPTGLVAAYSFDEGSGSVVADASGNGHVGTVSGATWAGGRYGHALSFNGTNASVLLGSLGTFYQGGFTLEAWVQKASATRSDAAVVGSWAGNGPMLWVDHIATHYFLTLGGSYSGYLDSGAAPVAGQWQHLAATYDGTTARYYIDGSLVASRAAGGVGNSDVWRIGAYGSSPGGFFDGLIDDVRIYDQARSGSEIQTDMDHGVPAPDTSPPTAPGSPNALGGLGQVALSWDAASDNVGIAQYAVYRSTIPGFTPSEENRIGQPIGTSYTDIGLAAGTYFYKVAATDAAGNIGPVSSEASAAVSADTTSPTVAIDSPAGGVTLSGQVAVNATADDDQGLVGVQFKLDGQSLGAEVTSSPYSVGWDTRGETNGPHTLTAIARDGAGNSTTSSSVAVTVSNSGVSTSGLRLAYGFEEGGGALTGDSSGSGVTGTLAGGATWASGRYGGGVSLNGSSGEVDPPSLGTFYRTAFTYEAWVYKQTSKVDVGVVGTWAAGQGGGAMIWVDHVSGHYRLTLGGNFGDYLDSGRSPAIRRWQHVAATYDGTTARFYVDGVEVASKVFTANVGSSSSWRIGAYGASATGFFDGAIDDVRIYDRALSAGEIAAGMATRIQPDTTPPSVTGTTPTDGATGVDVGGSLAVTFSEPMKASTIDAAAFELKDSSDNVIPLSVTYDASTNRATLSLQAALGFNTTYTAVVKAGGAKDLAGNAVAGAPSWSFTTPVTAPQVLLLNTATNPFSTYLGEILRNEGLDDFSTVDAALMTPALLANFGLVVLGDMSLAPSQVSTLTGWVNGGGNLVAMHPDKQLAGLLGLTDADSTLANAYLKVDTATPPGAGIVGQTIQFHGTADRYALNGASAVATLYSDANTQTTSPAVTLRSVGSSGGQAAAFTYDLARSVVYTRQGNPAWAGQERDGVPGIRPDDMFYGAKTGDVKPDWIDTNKIAIPQADEQQRLLVNLMTLMERDKMPLPHFWYLPRGKKAVVLLSGDDHSPSMANGGTASNFDWFKSVSPAGCSLTQWECVRATSWIFPNSALTNAQAAGYQADGFEIALHPVVASCPLAPVTEAELSAVFDTQLAAFRAKYTSIPSPEATRIHCVFWPDWLSSAKVELAHGIRIDGNYYHYPGSWIGSKPGFMNGGGFPMRFAGLDGTTVDIYQANTNITDEATSDFGTEMDSLLDKALGPEGYYGAFGTNIHTDNPAPLIGNEEIVASAQARGVPLISYKQMLDWLDGRNNSTIRSTSWNDGTFAFSTTVGAGATGLQTMLPTDGPSGTLSGLTCNGSSVDYSVQTIKGTQYAMFDSVTGTCQATYSS
jgi:chitodextrinase